MQQTTALRVGALSKVSIQPDEADHSSSNGNNRPALAANDQAEADHGRAKAHHCDVSMIAAVGAFNLTRGTRQTCGHVPGQAGRSDARTDGGHCVAGVDRSRRRVERHLSGEPVAITRRGLSS